MSLRRILIVLMGVLVLQSNALTATEGQIKAVFLEKFTHLIEWPQNDNDKFIICVLNDVEFAQTLKDVYIHKTFKKKPVDIIVLNANDTIPKCQLLFIGKTTKRTDLITKKFAGEPVLTVSDERDFVTKDVMVTMFINDKRFKYIINQKAAQYSNINISYLLLKSAQEVIK